MTDPVTVLARVPAGEHPEAVTSALLAYADHVRADPGTVAFEVYRPGDGDGLVVWETYVDQEAFDRHLSDPRNADFNGELRELTGAGSVVTILTRLTPQTAR